MEYQSACLIITKSRISQNYRQKEKQTLHYDYFAQKDHYMRSNRIVIAQRFIPFLLPFYCFCYPRTYVSLFSLLVIDKPASVILLCSAQELASSSLHLPAR